MKNGVYTQANGITKKAGSTADVWYYVKNGVYTKATGIAKRADGSSNGWYYVKNGKYTSATLFAQKADGSGNKYYYVKDGMLKRWTGIVKESLGGKTKWYYINRGVYTKATGITLRADGSSKIWYYVKNGVYTKYTGMADKADGAEKGTIYYVKNGRLNTELNGIVEYNGLKLVVTAGVAHYGVVNPDVNALSYFDGIDISAWNGVIDFTKVYNAGVRFIIPRQGYSTDTDIRFMEYVKSAKDAGISVPGVYHFLYSTNVKEAKKEAESAVKAVEAAGLPKTTVIWADIEYDTVDSAKKDGITLTDEDQKKMTEAFCKTIKDAGYATGIYTNQDYMYRVFGSGILKSYDIWLADYEGDIAYDCVYRQTGMGTIDGINGDVDTNVFVGKYTAYTAGGK